MENYNYIDLFHGIGGFALGAHLAGMQFENHFCSDVEPYCQRLYAIRFPDSVQLGDIRTIDTDRLKQEYGEKWIISGGFPCQDISVAGKGVGIHGERSGLWFEYWRLIRDLQPRFAIMENVGALTIRGLDAVLGSLAEIGYDAEWQDIRASDVGAPHRRERIWIVAYPRLSESSGRDKKTERIARQTCGQSASCGSVADDDGQRCEGGSIPVFQRGSLEAGVNVNGSCEEMADSSILRWGQGNQVAGGTREGAREEKERDGLADRGAISDAVLRGRGQVEQLHGAGAQGERALCAPGECGGAWSWWSTEPDVGRVANGVPARVDRLRGLGNAIVPQIAGMLFGLIKEQL